MRVCAGGVLHAEDTLVLERYGGGAQLAFHLLALGRGFAVVDEGEDEAAVLELRGRALRVRPGLVLQSDMKPMFDEASTQAML